MCACNALHDACFFFGHLYCPAIASRSVMGRDPEYRLYSFLCSVDGRSRLYADAHQRRFSPLLMLRVDLSCAANEFKVHSDWQGLYPKPQEKIGWSFLMPSFTCMHVTPPVTVGRVCLYNILNHDSANHTVYRQNQHQQNQSPKELNQVHATR